jgi:hypothetical protein
MFNSSPKPKAGENRKFGALEKGILAICITNKNEECKV